MTRDSIPPSGQPRPRRCGPSPRCSRRERIVVLAPPGLATAATFVGLSGDILVPVWLTAVAWSFLASFALALHAGLRHGDCSAFHNHKHEPNREEEMDHDLRVGAYAFIRERDDVLADRDPRRSADAGHDLS